MIKLQIRKGELKNMKKILAIMITATMVLTLPLCAFAADTYECTVSCVEKGSQSAIEGAPTLTTDIEAKDGGFIVKAPEIDGYIAENETVEWNASDLKNGTSPTTEDTAKFEYSKSAMYSVLYEDKDGNSLKNAEIKEGKVGDTVTETAVEIKGFSISGDNSKSITLDEDSSKNTILFVYDLAEGYVTYSVSYVDEDGEDIADKITGAGEVGEVITEDKLEVDGYDLYNIESSIVVEQNESDNTISFALDEDNKLNDVILHYKNVGEGASSSKDNSTDGPKTGDAGIILYGFMSIGSLAGAGFGLKRKFSRKK